MRKIMLLAAALLLVILTNAQARKAGKGQMDFLPAASLPEGTSFNKGNIEIKKGYTTSFADNKGVIVVQKQDGNITGAFSCNCAGSGTCSIIISGNILVCTPTGNCGSCYMSTTVNPKAGVAITKSGTDWKKVILPSAQ